MKEEKPTKNKKLEKQKILKTNIHEEIRRATQAK